MAAEVSSMVREVSGYMEEGEGQKDLVTRDLLGGGGEVDVGLGWDRRIDLLGFLVGSVSRSRFVLISRIRIDSLILPCFSPKKVKLSFPTILMIFYHSCLQSGKTRAQKSGDGDGGGSDPVLRELHDLNLPPPAPTSAGTVISEESSSLDLALSGTAAGAAPASVYRSVCTLEKVKSALERAERESRWSYRLPADCGSSASPSSSTTSSSLKRRAPDDGVSAEAQDSPSPPSAPTGGMVAAGCPCCLLYVLITTADPRCPRCDSHVPFPAMKKKPRIDLNSSSAVHYY